MADPVLPDVPALRVHEPPAGGLGRLRVALDREDAPPRPWWLVAPAALAVAAVVALLVFGRGRPPRMTPVARATTAAPAATAMSADPAMAAGGDVAFYWVASEHRAPRAVAPEISVVDGRGAPPPLVH